MSLHMVRERARTCMSFLSHRASFFVLKSSRVPGTWTYLGYRAAGDGCNSSCMHTLSAPEGNGRIRFAGKTAFPCNRTLLPLLFAYIHASLCLTRVRAKKAQGMT